MDINSFLLENLIDIYAKYCEYAEEMSEEEFEELFELEDGTEMTDLEFFLENSSDILNEEVLDELYCFVTDTGVEKDISLDNLVSFLASKYYVYNYNKDNNVIKYLKNSSLNDIVNLFVENINFGMDLLKTYFFTLIDGKRCENNRKIIYDNNDQEKLIEFEKKNNSVTIMSLNNMLRKVIYNLYNHYTSYGCDDITALNNTWEYFFNDFDPLGELDQLGFDFISKQNYKMYLLGLIYADLYEDVCNESIIQSENPEDRLALVLPLISVRMGMIAMPKEEGTRNRLLKHFILLQDDKEKVKQNREKTYKDNRIIELKKVNPFYILDELTF